METVNLSKTNVHDVAARAAEVVRDGGIILYPTDTLYGLGADALSDEAVAKVYALKGRDEGKPMHAIVADTPMAARYGEVDERISRAIEILPKGQVTFVIRKKAGVESGIAKGIDTFGFRIPDHDFCAALLREFRRPIIATSANRAGEPPGRTISTILEQLEHSHILKNVGMIDLVVDAGELPPRAASTVVDLTGERPVILREGAIPGYQVLRILAA